MWDLPGPGMEPASPALAGGFLTTAPPGKSLFHLFITRMSTICIRLFKILVGLHFSIENVVTGIVSFELVEVSHILHIRERRIKPLDSALKRTGTQTHI